MANGAPSRRDEGCAAELIAAHISTDRHPEQECSRDLSRSVRVTDMARYLVGNGDEVVCEMEHFPKHGIASFGSLGIAATFRIGDGCTLISSLAGQLSVLISRRCSSKVACACPRARSAVLYGLEVVERQRDSASTHP
jgi:hypothetical protein